MTDSSTPWGAEALWQQLEPLLPGISVDVVARSPSTNSALLERAKVSVGPGGRLVQVRPSIESGAFGRRAADVQPCLLVAEHQTSGRGRMGRSWKASPGASLTFSLSLPMDPPDWSGLSLAVGVALADALDPPGGDARRPLRIGLKWPNDLWLVDAGNADPLSGRKLGGILIETVNAGSQRLAVVGIGLNVMPMTTGEMRSGFGCVQELMPAATAPSTLHRIAVPLAQALVRFNEAGFAAFADDFARRDLLDGHAVYTTQADLPEGVARGVTPAGALRIETHTGLHEVTSGEVSVRLEGTPPDSATSPL